ncbi:MAG: hypothetical protein COY75_09995 [Nitrospirae bacterium CG_4_10_14_0_8_um_filter_41_23]|nr:hypothetical protein [Nitrospirota bacterium]OIP61150.1 MAG: hypothetical protein AUK38_01425 [Nitrospirae bacterium CG2_30_41_42]PIQ93431.1 MAG: hypothetical protein COV68_09935 [Nitrospirae bacterium CG11_big_fil_rev_8_21_14_0_20_41_14]PIV44311.1 MAG: hypothetical protein COS27_02220 [Nitrospirae bacterium CG02_land_8_20_14_3_00_41_53]PIW86599.1 MAG: hypothetical protein COZ94_09590 [Nitrospirae bacterium CG_4_8_14_3_um_filter_41_47]PIY86064.1 MAG: hypothetical protein COY75_09995 [Nitros
MEFKIEIAIVCALIRLDDDVFANQLIEEHYSNFLTDKDPSLRVDINIRPIETPSLLESTQVAIEHYVNGNILFFKGFRGDIEGRVNLSSGEAEGVTIRVPFRFDALLRILYSLWLVKSGGFLLHAAGVKDNDDAYVFSGVSGSGKTTVARLSEDNKVIQSDELIAIRSINGSYQVYGTPFMGEFARGGQNCTGDLRQIFLLKKDNRNFLAPLNQGQRLKELFQCILFFGENTNLLNTLFNLCTDIAEKIPFYQLHFLPDRSFWKCIKTMEVIENDRSR